MSDGLKISKLYSQSIYQVESPYLPSKQQFSKLNMNVLVDFSSEVTQLQYSKLNINVFSIVDAYIPPESTTGGVEITRLYAQSLYKVDTPQLPLKQWFSKLNMNALISDGDVIEARYSKIYMNTLNVVDPWISPSSDQTGVEISKIYSQGLFRVSEPQHPIPMYQSKLNLNAMISSVIGNQQQRFSKLYQNVAITNVTRPVEIRASKMYINVLVITEPYYSNIVSGIKTPDLDLQYIFDGCGGLVYKKLEDKILLYEKEILEMK